MLRMLSLLHPLTSSSKRTGAAEWERPMREGVQDVQSSSGGLLFISVQHPSAQLLFPCKAGKDAFSLGRGTWLHHPSPCLSLEKTKHLLHLGKYTKKGGRGRGSSNERKTSVPSTMKRWPLGKKRRKKKRGGHPNVTSSSALRSVSW